jgi:hypothetical protein
VTKENGKELRRLQEVELRNNVPGMPSSLTESGNDTSSMVLPSTADEAKGVSVIPVQGNADATQLLLSLGIVHKMQFKFGGIVMYHMNRVSFG